jgi:hypothetical protein
LLDTSTDNSILNSWTAQNPNEFPIAVGSTIRTFNQSTGGLGSEYSLNGSFTGTSYLVSVAASFLTDGTHDAAHNYAIDAASGTVYSFGRDWSGGTPLFSELFANGVAYDPTHNALWVSGFNSTIVEFPLNGSAGTTIAIPGFFPVGLAFDAGDQTFWMADLFNPGNFLQFGMDGSLVNTRTYTALAGLNIGGLEFAVTETPEPGVFGLTAIGLLALAALRTRAWSRSESR